MPFPESRAREVVMKVHRRSFLTGLAAVVGFTLQPWIGAAHAETLIGSNIDTRYMLAFSVETDAVASLMPEGWSAIGFPRGPLAGANLLIGLEDRQLAMTADGAPAAPAKSRAAAVMALGKRDDGVRLFVLRVYSTDAEYDLFPDGVAAEVSRSSRLEETHQRENWRIAPSSGGEIAITFDYEVGVGKWVSDEARPFSASSPDLSRVFRYDQLVELVMSKAVGKPMSGEFSVSVNVPELGGILDGSEELVGLLSYPVYVREVFEP